MQSKYIPFHYENLDPITVKLFQMRVGKKDNNSCKLWLGHIDDDGYGVFRTTIKKIGYMSQAHRVSWMLANGRDIPNGLHICHQCDIPTCVNPEHLFLGTHLDNVRDMCNKGRQARGVKNGNTILSDTDVLEIRKLSKLNYSDEEISKKFGISRRHTNQIVNYRRWKHVK